MRPTRIDYCAVSGKSSALDKKCGFLKPLLPSAPSFGEWNQDLRRRGRFRDEPVILQQPAVNPHVHPAKRFPLPDEKKMNRSLANTQSPSREMQSPCRLQELSTRVRGRSWEVRRPVQA